MVGDVVNAAVNYWREIFIVSSPEECYSKCHRVFRIASIYIESFVNSNLVVVKITDEDVGLSFVKELVELHKGKIDLHSPVKDNRGTRFEIEFAKGKS